MAFILIVLQVIYFFGISFTAPPTVTVEADRATHSFFVEIADEPEEIAKGLMERQELCDDCGMIFIFPDEQIRNFWMKNTLIPLDIIFADADGNVVDYFSMEPCKADPCPTYTSKKPAKYALEIPKGTFLRFGKPQKFDLTKAF